MRRSSMFYFSTEMNTYFSTKMTYRYQQTFEWHSLAAHLYKLGDTCKHAAKHISGASSAIEPTIVVVSVAANLRVGHISIYWLKRRSRNKDAIG